MRKVLIDISGRTNCGPVIGIELAKALAHNNYEVYAVVAKDALNIEDWINEKSIKDVFTIQTYTSYRNLIALTTNFIFHGRKQLKKHFETLKFDYVFKPIFHPWAEMIISNINYKRIVTLCHDPKLHSGERFLTKLLYKKHIRNSDDIVIMTKSFRSDIRHNYGFSDDRIHYMPLGLMSIYKEKQTPNFSSIYSKSNVNFLFFGRIEKYKGVGVLVSAFKILQKQYSNITLTIAGKGNLNEIITSLNGDKSIRIFNKYIPDEEVGCFFDGPNVVTVLPYLDATQSGVIPISIEYESPIIASNTGGLKEQMLDGKFGLYTNAGDAMDLAEKMSIFIKTPDEFEKQRKLMKNAVTELKWDKVVAALMNEL